MVTPPSDENTDAGMTGKFYGYTMLRDPDSGAIKTNYWGSGYGISLVPWDPNKDMDATPSSFYSSSSSYSTIIDLKNSSARIWARMPSKTGYSYYGLAIGYINNYNSSISTKTFYDSSFIGYITNNIKNTYYHYSGHNEWLGDVPGGWDAVAVMQTNKYKIRYSNLQGTTCSGATSATYDKSVYIPNPSTRTGYTFAGWTASNITSSAGRDISNGGGNWVNWNGSTKSTYTYYMNLTSTDNATVTMTANWDANQYDVYFNNADGTGGTDSTKATYGRAMPSITTPTKSGFKFQGYYDSNGVQYYNENGGSVRNYDKASHTTLYARWKDSQAPTISRVTWQQNGSTGYYVYAYATDNVGVNRVQFPTWTDASGQDDIQTNWQTNSAASGSSGSWTIGGQTYNYRYLVNRSAHNNEYGPYNTHIYAYDAAGNSTAATISKVTFYQVTLNTNDTSGGISGGVTSSGTTSVIVTNGTAMPAITVPVRTGYNFDGYYDTSAITGGTRYYTSTGASARSWDKTANTTLYARWTGKSYTVGLHGNGGSGGGTSITATYGSAMPALASLPSKSGWNFLGYYDLQTGGTKYYTASGTSARIWNKAVSNTTLYAQWQEKTWSEDYYASSYGGGTGTELNPYIISTAAHLARLAYATNNNIQTTSGRYDKSAYYKQTADINLNDHLWQPIGNSSNNFNGTYDGGLYEIINARINSQVEYNVGLFGTTSNAQINNISLNKANISASSTVGGIVGCPMTGTISNCRVISSKINATNNYAGGIAGNGTTTIANCSVLSSNISAKSYSGGIMGQSSVSIKDCSVINSTITATSNAGTIFGTYTGTCVACYGSGTVNGTSTKVMYGNSSAWTNWSLVPNVNGGLPVQKGLYHIGGFTSSQEVYNYLTTQGYTVQS